MPGAKEFCDSKIRGKKVVVFSKTYCPYCTKAKKEFKVLIEKNKLSPADYEVIEIENMPNCDEIQDYMREITKGRSVPRVFIKGNFVGGGDETVALARSGELERLVQ